MKTAVPSVREPGAAPDRQGLSITHLGIGCVDLRKWLVTFFSGYPHTPRQGKVTIIATAMTMMNYCAGLLYAYDYNMNYYNARIEHFLCPISLFCTVLLLFSPSVVSNSLQPLGL